DGFEGYACAVEVAGCEAQLGLEHEGFMGVRRVGKDRVQGLERPRTGLVALAGLDGEQADLGLRERGPGGERLLERLSRALRVTLLQPGPPGPYRYLGLRLGLLGPELAGLCDHALETPRLEHRLEQARADRIHAGPQLQGAAELLLGQRPVAAGRIGLRQQEPRIDVLALLLQQVLEMDLGRPELP